MSERTLEVDWQQEHTTIVIANDDGTFDFSTSSTGGPELLRIFDPDGGPEIDRDALIDFLAEELA